MLKQVQCLEAKDVSNRDIWFEVKFGVELRIRSSVGVYVLVDRSLPIGACPFP